MWHVQRLMNGGEVVRYHTWPTANKQTVGCHSWGVAMIVQRLLPNCRKELILAALQHDMGEQEMGDVPAPAKWRAPEFAAQLDKAEDCAREEMGFEPIALTDTEQRILKMADILELCAWAKSRMICGDLAAARVFSNGHSYANNLTRKAPLIERKIWVNRAIELLNEITTWTHHCAPKEMGEV